MPGPARSEFTTTDPDLARELMSAAYVDATMRFHGSRADLRLEHCATTWARSGWTTCTTP